MTTIADRPGNLRALFLRNRVHRGFPPPSGSIFKFPALFSTLPALLLRSLFAMYVAVPLAALAVIMLVPVGPGVRAALLVLAVSAGAPLLPRKLSGIGNGAYIFSLVVASSALAIVLVPLWVEFLSRRFDIAQQISPLRVMLKIAEAFLLPLLVGLGVRAAAPTFSERLSRFLLPAGGIVLCLAGVAVLAMNWVILRDMHGPGLLALTIVMLAALAIGHALGGPLPDNRTALAIACATRHVGIATTVATAFRGPKTLVIVAAYVVTSALVSIPYLHWRRRAGARAASLLAKQA